MSPRWVYDFHEAVVRELDVDETHANSCSGPFVPLYQLTIWIFGQSVAG